MLRRQLPVYSPLSLAAVARGVSGLLGGDAGTRQVVTDWLQKKYQADFSILTDSGTSALALAMRASVAEGQGLSVALPAYGCFDLVTAALAGGVGVRWYDVDPVTLGPDWRSLETALKNDVAAVVAVHLYGIPVDMARIRHLATSSGAVVIEDAAQGAGGELDGRPLGALGDMGILSFGRGKGITGGGGGALLATSVRGRDLLREVESGLPGSRGNLKSTVGVVAQWMMGRPSIYGIPSALPFLHLGETVFQDPEPARRINSVSTAVLSMTLESAAPEAATRRANAATLASRFAPSLVPRSLRGTPGYLRLPIISPPQKRGAVTRHSARVLGIMPGYPRVLSSLPGPTGIDARFPGTEELVRNLFTLPVHSRLTPHDLALLESWSDGFSR